MENVRNGLMSEMLYADDLVLTSEMGLVERLKEKFWKRKEAFESKRLKMNLGKTKVVVSGAEGEVSLSKVDQCTWYLWEASNGKFSVVCEMRGIDLFHGLNIPLSAFKFAHPASYWVTYSFEVKVRE